MKQFIFTIFRKSIFGRVQELSWLKHGEYLRNILFYFSCLVPLSLLWGAPLQVELEGNSAILMNAETGKVLFEKNAYQLCYPASTTKVATALYTLHTQNEKALQTLITADAQALTCVSQVQKLSSSDPAAAYWLEVDGKHIDIKIGEELTLLDLLRGMLISSGNDASNVIAQFVGGTISCFMEQLNSYLKGIGCQQTHFCNPHGLYHPEHQTTAYDLAIMTREALKQPLFREIVSQPQFARPKTNKQKAMVLLQSNRLLRPGKLYYSKAIGVKTGYHARAKHTFIGTARFHERTLIVVLLGYKNRIRMFQDAIMLFEMAFNQPKIEATLLKAGPQTFTQEIAYADHSLLTCLNQNLTLAYYPAEDPNPKCLLYWDSLILPIQKGQKVGEIHLISDTGELLKNEPLFAAETVHWRWPYYWIMNFRTFIHTHLMFIKIMIGFLLLVIIVGIWICVM